MCIWAFVLIEIFDLFHLRYEKRKLHSDIGSRMTSYVVIIFYSCDLMLQVLFIAGKVQLTREGELLKAVQLSKNGDTIYLSPLLVLVLFNEVLSMYFSHKARRYNIESKRRTRFCQLLDVHGLHFDDITVING